MSAGVSKSFSGSLPLPCPPPPLTPLPTHTARRPPDPNLHGPQEDDATYFFGPGQGTGPPYEGYYDEEAADEGGWAASSAWVWGAAAGADEGLAWLPEGPTGEEEEEEEDPEDVEPLGSSGHGHYPVESRVQAVEEEDVDDGATEGVLSGGDDRDRTFEVSPPRPLPWGSPVAVAREGGPLPEAPLSAAPLSP